MEHCKRVADRSERSEKELQAILRGINRKQKEDVLQTLAELPGRNCRDVLTKSEISGAPKENARRDAGHF
jgi:hypothetical protein